LREIEKLHVFESCEPGEQKFIFTAKCEALFDNRYVIRYNCLINIINTILVSTILGFGVFYFNKDMNDLVLDPIDKMTSKIKDLSKNPIEAIKIKNTEEENVNSKKIMGCCNTGDKNKEPMETVILEQTLGKISALLALGFGEAGAEIISKNIQNKADVDVDPTIAGKKVMGIYGFCDIRNFTDSTEILEEEVMIFVNEIAEIVHELTAEYGGSANKNIGDAFLLVWKFDDKFTSTKGDIVLLNSHEVNQIVDMALISFLKIIMKSHKSYDLQKVKIFLK
jgi:hypothetical protein